MSTNISYPQLRPTLVGPLGPFAPMLEIWPRETDPLRQQSEHLQRQILDQELQIQALKAEQDEQLKVINRNALIVEDLLKRIEALEPKPGPSPEEMRTEAIRKAFL